MHPAVLFGVPLAAVVTAFTLGLLRRRRLERRAALADALALAARRAVPLHVPLARAAGVASSRRADALRAIATDLEMGRPLAEALRIGLPREFPAPVAAAIDAGERASRLPQALDAIAAEASRDLSRGHKMALAAFYPAILFIGVAALNGLVIERNLREMDSIFGSETSDLFLSGGSLYAIRWLVYGVASLLCLGILLRVLRRPVTGVASARFLRTCSLVLSAGRPVHAALAAAAASSGAPRLSRAATAAAAALVRGDPLARAWRSLPIAPASRERLAAASMTSPSGPSGLTSLLDEVAAGCEARDARRADRFVRWSVPVATAAAGLVVALDYATLTSVWAHAQEVARPW